MKQARYYWKLAGTLLLLCAITAGLLGAVHAVTKERIAENQRQKAARAMQLVLPSAQYTDCEIAPYDCVTARGTSARIDAVTRADDGYVVQVTLAGSQGDMTLLVGLREKTTCTGIYVVSQSETAGLGAVCAQDSAAGAAFRAQFSGLHGAAALEKDGGHIDALTGATVTSRAVCEAVNAAQLAVQALD